MGRQASGSLGHILGVQPKRRHAPQVKGRDIELYPEDDWPPGTRPTAAPPTPPPAAPKKRESVLDRLVGKTPYGKAAKVLSERDR